MSDIVICSKTPGEAARRARARAGLSLREEAAQLGISHQWLSRIERGEADPDVHTARLLQRWYEIPMEWWADTKVLPDAPPAAEAEIEAEPAERRVAG